MKDPGEHLHLVFKSFFAALRQWLIISVLCFGPVVCNAQWAERNVGIYGGQVQAITVVGTDLMACVFNGGVYRSTDNGATWNRVNTGMPNVEFAWSIAVNGSNIFVGSLFGLYRSTDSGATWQALVIPSGGARKIEILGSSIFVASYGGGIIRSTNNGATWTAVNNGVENPYTEFLGRSGTTLFSRGQSGSALLRSVDNGANWTPSATGLTSSPNAIATIGTDIYVGTQGAGVSKSIDGGLTWTQVNTGLTDLIVTALAVNGTTLLASTSNGVFKSTNSGANWTASNTGISNPVGHSFLVNGAAIYYCSDGSGIFKSVDGGTNWVNSSSGIVDAKITGFAKTGSNLFVSSYGSGVFKSTNDGASWSQASTGLPDNRLNAIISDGTNLYVGTYNSGIYKSTNDGANWVLANTGFTGFGANCFTNIGTTIFAGADVVYRTTNGGTNWSPVATGLTSSSIYSLATIGTTLFALNSNSEVFRSVNNGTNWSKVTATGLSGQNISGMVSLGSNLYVHTWGGGIFKSSNNGDDWVAVNNGLSFLFMDGLVVAGTTLYAVSNNSTTFVSINGGSSWSQLNEGFGVQKITAATNTTGHVIVGTRFNGVWARPLDDMVPKITSISPESGSMGSNVTLTGKYFNSFLSNMIVYFGGVKAPFVSLSGDELTVKIPPGVGYDPPTVTLAGLTGQAPKPIAQTFSSNGVLDDVAFNTDFTYVAAVLPHEPELADLDGDDKADMIVAHRQSSLVSIYRNTATLGTINGSTFAPKVDFNVTSSATGVKATDIDGDGKFDLVVTYQGGSAISVLHNKTTPGTIDATAMATAVDFATGSGTYNLATGDIDGDGKMDVVTANSTNNNVSILRNTSTMGSITSGSFATKIDMASGISPQGIALGDLDGDGKPDMVASNNFSNTISVYRNLSTYGAISFTAKTDIATAAGPSDVEITDLDGDNKRDVVVMNGTIVSVFRNTTTAIGNITFAARQTIAISSQSTAVECKVAHINGDARPDIVVTSGPTFTLLANTSTVGNISFAVGQVLRGGTDHPKAGVGDVDGDGKPEITVTDAGFGAVRVFQNRVLVAEPSSQPALSAVASGNNINLTFTNRTAIPNCAGYLLWRTTSGTPPSGATIADRVDPAVQTLPGGVTLVGVITSPGTTYSDGGLQQGTTYSYLLVPFNASGSLSYLYNFKIDGTASVATATTPFATNSNVTSNGSFIYPVNIDYRSVSNQVSNITAATGTEVAQFMINDGGGSADSDPGATILQSISFSVSSSAVILRAALYDGTTELAEVAGGSTITFNGLSVSAPDNGSKTISLKVSYKATVPDNTQNQFTVTSVTASAAGSGFADANGGGAASSITGDRNRIEVTAAKINFVQQPSNVELGATMTPAVSAEAVDALNNRDVDFNASFGLTSTGTMTGSPTASIAAGVGTFAAIIHTQAATGRTLSTTNVSGLTDAMSNTFMVSPYNLQSDIIANASFTYPLNINYANTNFQQGDVTLTSGLEVSQFTIRDGGSAPDNDITPTTLTSISFTLTNSSALRRVALYDNTTELGELAGAETVTFPGLSVVVPDNGTKTLSLRVTFNATVTDNSQVAFTVSNAQASDGSGFSSANAGAATSSLTGDNNRIEVAASRLRFSIVPPSLFTAQGSLATSFEVTATDAFDNKDIDYGENATVTNVANLPMEGVPATFANGVLTFSPAFRFMGWGSTTISVSSGSVTGVTSEAVTVRAVEPVSQPTEITLDVSSTVSGQFNAATGNPDGYLVLRSTGTAVTGSPEDGVTYVAGNNAGGASVVTVGAGRTFNETLSAGTQYTYGVFAFNGSGASINYLSTSPLQKTALTLPAAPGDIEIKDVTDSRFEVQWAPVTSSLFYELEISVNDFATLLTGYNPKKITDATREVVSNLSAKVRYKLRVRAKNESGYSPYSTVVPVETKEAAAFQIVENTPSAVGNDTKLSATVTGGTGTVIVEFYSKGLLATAFQKTTLTSTTSTFEITVTSSMFDELGLEYYFAVNQGPGTAEKTTTKQKLLRKIAASEKSLTGLSSGGQPENYRIISIPYKLDDDLVQSIFALGETDPSRWRLVHYRNKKNVELTGVNKIEPGLGYWINTVDPVTPNIGKGSIVPLDANNAFVLHLDQGWNQIGDPFPFNIKWSNVKAANPGIAIGSLSVFNPSTTIIQNSDDLNQWSGGFVFADVATDIKFPAALKGSSRMQGGLPSADLSNTDWYVPLRLQHGDGYNSDAGFGMHVDAEGSKDIFDEITVPRFMKFLEVHTTHPEFFEPKFQRDIVPTANRYTWDFEIESAFEGKTMSLSWNNQDFGTSSAALVLYDEVAGALVDMKEFNSYTFEYSAKRQIRIMFAADGNDLEPKSTFVSMISPNPADQAASFNLVSHEPVLVMVDVVDGIGRKVRGIAHDTFKTGVHPLQWYLDDANGIRVPAGLYLVRAMFPNGRQQTQKLIVK